MLVMMPIAGRLYNRTGPRLMVGVGLGFLVFGFWDLGQLTTAVGYWDLAWPQIWQGVGFSFLFAALSTAALAPVPKPEITAATGLYNVVRQVMGSIGIALAATLLTHSEATYHATLVERASGPVAQRWIDTTMAGLERLGATAAGAREHALALLESLISRQATVLAYNHIFELVAIMFAVVVPLLLLIPRSGHSEGADVMVD